MLLHPCSGAHTAQRLQRETPRITCAAGPRKHWLWLQGHSVTIINSGSSECASSTNIPLTVELAVLSPSHHVMSANLNAFSPCKEY